MDIQVISCSDPEVISPGEIGLREATAHKANLHIGEPVLLRNLYGSEANQVRFARWKPVAPAKIGPDGCLVTPEVLEKLAVGEGATVRMGSGRRPGPDFLLFCWTYDESVEGRPPEDILVVLDVSWSMGGFKIWNAKSALFQFVERKREVNAERGIDDRLALITFGGDEESGVAYACPFVSQSDDDYGLFVQAVEEVTTQGVTPMRAALAMAKDQIEKMPRIQGIERRRRIILITDGYPYPEPPERVLEVVEELAAKEVRIATVGIGDDFDRDLLMQIAARTRAPFVEVYQIADLPVLMEELA